ncbi:DUF6371 domain-containing protein [Nonlabens antarcticus]|uniref:DUF6371 domain-containing protein n=1 Tax=Nonlabens antarcticus TaxID=392714 RepID=UPI0018910426|nr:DUF6371 domain-containing protein [Nonlabens antarcticus]
MKHLYSLDKSSKKYLCPKCKRKRFVLYLNNSDAKILDYSVGRCDAEQSCGNHYKPRQYFGDNELVRPLAYPKQINQAIERSVTYHKDDEVIQSMISGECNLYRYLSDLYNRNLVNSVWKLYKVGTAPHWYNSTIFWLIDNNQNIRGGKMISYSNKGKRSKYINWVHSYQLKNGKLKEFVLEQCFFGEHLIRTSQKPIAIVESEKTALIMSLKFDKYLWLAAGSLNGINFSKMVPLKGRKIVLYPDLGINEKESPFKKWSLKSMELNKKGFDISVSTLLENRGSINERREGLDLADYFT